MRTEVAVDINACPEHVWAVLTDVSRWPEWTTAVRSIRLLDGPVLGPGRMLRVRASGLPDRTWRVTGFSRHRSFTWTGDGIGARAHVAFRLRHVVGESAGVSARTRVTIEHERAGWIAGVIQQATGHTTTRHLRALVEGLRVRCEQRRPISSV